MRKQICSLAKNKAIEAIKGRDTVMSTTRKGEITMFAINNNSILNVNHFRSGKKQDGTPYTLLTFIEKYNQPDGVENNSSSTVKMWDADISGTPTDGCQIVLESFVGINWKHENRTYNGKKSYFDTVEIVGAKVRVLD